MENKSNQITEFIFFGNYFYGICAVALAIEASLQQYYVLNDVVFYIGLFAATTWFYTKAYITEQTSLTVNQRTNWYIKQKIAVAWSQHILEVILFICLAIFLSKYWYNILRLSWVFYLLVGVFPLVAGLYYGINSNLFGRFNLRKIGWIKPFVIGFTWAGLTTVYPTVYGWIINALRPEITLISIFLFIKNFMFVTVLCIMFDIKDYAMDYNHQLKTFVVNHGLRFTIFYILIPLSIAGLGSFLAYGYFRDFSLIRIAMNTIPFLWIIAIAYSLHERKSILYYLILIDGSMLVKALCGSIGVLFF